MTQPRALRPVARPLTWFAALASLATVAAAAPQAPVSSAGDTTTSSEADEAARSLKRVLFLRGGSVARGRSKFVDGQWQVRAKSGWQSLPADSVVRVRLERDVLNEAKRMSAGVGRDDGMRRVALADWMLRAGLIQEGLRELDRVLDADPDQERALALLASPPLPLNVSALAAQEPEALMRDVARAPASVRELAVLRLGQLEEHDALRTRLAASLRSHSPQLRAFAALALRRLFPGEGVRALATTALLDGSDEVRHEAALSLRAVQNEAVILPAVRALESESGSVRKHAIQALAAMQYPAAVPVLVSRLSTLSAPQSGSGARPPRSHIYIGNQMAYIQDFDVEVASGSAIADPQIGTLASGSVLDVRIVGVQTFGPAVESRYLRDSLAQLTGQEHSSKGWIAWFEENQADYLPRPGGPATPTTTGG